MDKLLFEAVFLDMDGLLLDTEIGYFAAWQQAAKIMGYELSEEFCATLSGMHWSMLQQSLIAKFGENFNLQRFQQHSSERWHLHIEQNGIPPRPGFESLMNTLQRFKIPYVLVTNSRKHNAIDCLQKAGVAHLFPDIISRDDVQNGKPDPEILFKAAGILALPSNLCLVVEDSLTGLQAAQRAGMYSVWIPSVYPVVDACAKLAGCRLDDLGQLAEIISNRYTI